MLYTAHNKKSTVVSEWSNELFLSSYCVCPSLHLQLFKEKHDNTVLIAETLQQKKLLGKYNRGQREAHTVLSLRSSFCACIYLTVQFIPHFSDEDIVCETLCPVSQFAVEEYEVLQDTLNLERDLRTEAEDFARAVILFFIFFYHTSKHPFIHALEEGIHRTLEHWN